MAPELIAIDIICNKTHSTERQQRVANKHSPHTLADGAEQQENKQQVTDIPLGIRAGSPSPQSTLLCSN